MSTKLKSPRGTGPRGASRAKPPAPDVPALVRGRAVTLVGRLASMSRHEFVELVEAHGGRYALGIPGEVAPLLVVGQKDLPLTSAGTLPEKLRLVRVKQQREGTNVVVLTEDQFLTGLGLEQYRKASDSSTAPPRFARSWASRPAASARGSRRG